MIGTLAVAGYRSLRDVCLPLGRLTVIRGGNGVGKSSLYQAFRLLADTAGGRLIGSLARAGGLESVLWAGPEVVSGAMRRGEVPVQGQAHRHRPVSLMLGFSGDDVSYLIDIGLPLPDTLTKFGKDPQIKREAVWVGPVLRPAATLVQRANGAVQVRVDAGWTRLPPIGHRESIVADLADPVTRPELALLRGMVASWRFYDDFRTDVGSPARAPQVGTWSPVLDHDGANLAPALQTVLESSRADDLAAVVDLALPGTTVQVRDADGWFGIELRQPGLLRPLSGAELSDGTLRFLLLAAALLSPSPPSLLVLNEPETSLHPEVLPAAAELIRRASDRTQVVVVTHSAPLTQALQASAGEALVENELYKELGETRVRQTAGLLDRPQWAWGSR